MWGLGFRILFSCKGGGWALGFRLWGLRVEARLVLEDLGFRVQGFEVLVAFASRFLVLGFRAVQGFG